MNKQEAVFEPSIVLSIPGNPLSTLSTGLGGVSVDQRNWRQDCFRVVSFSYLPYILVHKHLKTFNCPEDNS